MKIYRTGKTGPEWILTDEKKLGKPPSVSWDDIRTITLDGTKDKSGTRHTSLRIEIEPADVLALLKAFVKSGIQLDRDLALAQRKLKIVEASEWRSRAKLNAAKALQRQRKLKGRGSTAKADA